MKRTPAFDEVLNKVAGNSEVASVEIIRQNAARLNFDEFYALIGRAVRQPELLSTRFDRFVQETKFDTA